MSNHEPKGDLITGPPALLPDPTLTLTGQHSISLVPLTPSHGPGLFTGLGGPSNDYLYTYMPGGPFDDAESMAKHIDSLIESPVYFAYTIFSNSGTGSSLNQFSPQGAMEGTPVGIITLMNIVPSHRTIEIGHVLFGPTLQRTPASTEANYLLMKYAFEDLKYLRVEWKANDFNEPSKKAALRLGFKSEGVFRKHMVVKGRRRDTAWFSCLDEEWVGGVKKALEGWLAKGNFDESGGQRKKLEEFRENGV